MVEVSLPRLLASREVCLAVYVRLLHKSFPTPLGPIRRILVISDRSPRPEL